MHAPRLRCLASECRRHQRCQISSRCHGGTSSRRVGAGEAADTAAHAPHAPLRRALPVAPAIAHTALALPVLFLCSLRICLCVLALCVRAEFVLVVLAGLPVQPHQACAVRPSWPEARFARRRAFACTTSRSASIESGASSGPVEESEKEECVKNKNIARRRALREGMILVRDLWGVQRRQSSQGTGLAAP